MTRRPAVRAVVFDAGHTLLEMDYARLTAFLVSRGHDLRETAVTEAERRARTRLDTERAAQATRERTGEGRYVRYLAEYLAIADDAERVAIAEWRRGFNVPIGLCHQADGQAAKALQRARDAGLIVGVISNSNGSVQRALEIAGLAPHLAFVIDSRVVGISKPDPRIFALGLAGGRHRAGGDRLRGRLLLRRRRRCPAGGTRSGAVRSGAHVGSARLLDRHRSVRGGRPRPELAAGFAWRFPAA